MSHIIDVLRGAKKEKVLQYGHHQLSTYGIGKDRSVEEWRLLGRSLLHQGLLQQTTDGYSVLKLNPHSWEVMRRQRTVAIAVTTAPKPQPQPKEIQAADVEMLFQRLRHLRKQLADEQSVPPYVVFADSTLKLMAQLQPQTLAEFGKISGVGSHKLSQYGSKFVMEIQAYCQEQGAATAEVTTIAASSPDTKSLTFQLHLQGLSVEEIAQERSLKPGTIVDHLAELIESNQAVDINQLVIPVRQQIIVKAMHAVGTASLKSIYEYLGDYSYDEIRLVRAWWQRQNKL